MLKTVVTTTLSRALNSAAEPNFWVITQDANSFCAPCHISLRRRVYSRATSLKSILNEAFYASAATQNERNKTDYRVDDRPRRHSSDLQSPHQRWLLLARADRYGAFWRGQLFQCLLVLVKRSRWPGREFRKSGHSSWHLRSRYYARYVFHGFIRTSLT